MDCKALQYRAERDSVKMMRAHRLCISYCSGQAVTLQHRLSRSSWICSGHDHTVLPGRQSSARLCFGPDRDLLKPSGRLCAYGLPQHDSYWKTWGHFVFHPEFGGHRKLWLFSSLQFQRRIIGALFAQIWRSNFFFLPSVVWLLFLCSVLAINNKPMVGFFLCRVLNTAVLPERLFHVGGSHSLFVAGSSHLCQSNVITIPWETLQINCFTEVFYIT